jgi:hypothetical protein
MIALNLPSYCRQLGKDGKEISGAKFEMGALDGRDCIALN